MNNKKTIESLNDFSNYILYKMDLEIKELDKKLEEENEQ
jgi:hypothetical protein